MKLVASLYQGELNDDSDDSGDDDLGFDKEKIGSIEGSILVSGPVTFKEEALMVDLAYLVP